MIVSIEGMDGTGKSTIAKEVAKKIGFNYSEKSMKEFFNITDEQYENMCRRIENSNDTSLIAMFYGLSNALTMHLKEKNIIIDKHILYTYFWNNCDKTEKLFEYYNSIGIDADITILLYSSPENRIKHLKKRNENDPDLLNEKKLGFGYDRMVEYIQKYNVQFVFINTDNYANGWDIIDLIVEIINNKRNMREEEFNIYIGNINNQEMSEFNERIKRL